MNMNKQVASVAIAAMVCGCTPHERGSNAPGPSLLSPGPGMKTCTETSVPQKAMRIEITSLDIRNIKADIKELTTSTQYPYGDLNIYVQPPPVTAPTTALDVNLALEKNVSSTSQRNRMFIVVALDDATAKFYGQGLSVTSLHKNAKMFCRRDPTNFPKDFSDKQAAFIVEYDNDDTNSTTHTHATFNINLKVPQLDGSYLPVSIDPDVQNDG